MQTIIQKEKVTGMEFFDGNKEFDKSASVHIEEYLDFTTNRKKGSATGKYKMPSVEELKKLFHLECPFMAEIEWVQVQKGGSSTRVIKSLKPIAVQPTQPAQAKSAAQ